MKKFHILIILVLSFGFTLAQVKDQVITDAGAIADGKRNNQKIIQQLIDLASLGGGGRVIIPPGNFMTGTLSLKSGVELHISLGATLLGSHSTDDYLKLEHRAGLIIADGQHDITLSGEGILDGQGQELMVDIFKKLRSGALTDNPIWLVKRPEAGRALIVYFKGCTNVKVTGITLKNASNWVQDYRECDGVVIDSIKVQSTAYWNNDGLDITDSKNVRITNCWINSSDDAVCFKSENPDSFCENIFVDNCVLRSSANGLKFGTANYGGFKNFNISNLTVYDTYRSAIALESVDGGFMENIHITNVAASNTGNAIFIRRGHRNKTGPVSTLKDIHISNVTAQIPLYKPDQGYPIEGPPDHLRPGYDKMPVRPSSYHIYGHPYLPYNLIPSSITGIPGYPVQNVTLDNIEINFGGRADKNIAYIPLNTITTIPENEAGYPDFSMFGELPAWGFYLRHTENIKMNNVKLKFIEDDFRPAMVLDDVRDINFSNIEISTFNELPVILLNNVAGEKMKDLKMPVSENKAIMKSNYK